MRIAIVEQHYHPEYVETLLRLLENRFGIDDIDLYLSESVLKKIPREYQHNKQLNLCSNFINLEAHDIIFLNTIQPSMKDFYQWRNVTFCPGTKVILTIHNLNAWYNKKFVLRKNVLHSLDSFIVKKYTKELLDKVTDIVVVSDTLVDCAKEYFPDKNILFIPFKMVDDCCNYQSHSFVNFSIPGSFNEKRREYKLIFSVFDQLFKEYEDIRLQVLGKDKFSNEHKRKHPYIVNLNRYLSQEEYDMLLEESDFIICPSKEETHSVNTAIETYGKTKSYSYFDAVRKRKPLIIPSYLPVPKGFQECCIQYDGWDDLYFKIRDLLIHRNKIKQYQDKAKEGMEEYSLQKIQQYFDTSVLQVEEKASL